MKKIKCFYFARFIVCFSLIVLCFTSCFSDKELQEPGAEGPVVMRVWKANGEPPLEVRASSIEFIDNNGKFLDNENSDILLRNPIVLKPGLDSILHTSSFRGVFSQSKIKKEKINMLQPFISGYEDGFPIIGISDKVIVLNDKQGVLMKNMDFIHKMQSVKVKKVKMNEIHNTKEGKEWLETPTDELVNTALFGIPNRETLDF